jgi:TPR repeat protein
VCFVLSTLFTSHAFHSNAQQELHDLMVCIKELETSIGVLWIDLDCILPYDRFTLIYRRLFSSATQDSPLTLLHLLDSPLTLSHLLDVDACDDELQHRNHTEYFKRMCSKTFQECQRDAEHKRANAKFNLAVCYANGIGVETDIVQAIECYKEASDKDNDACAQYRLGFYYESGVTGYFNRNPDLSFEYYKLAAIQKHVQAMYRLGYCYINGIGVEKDETLGNKLMTEVEMQHTSNRHTLSVVRL